MKINVKIFPCSKKQNLEILKDIFGNEVYEVRVISVPEDGKANRELIEILSKHFNTPKSNITIKSGLSSRAKVVEIIN
ncbi:DUF167 domain-containing protein [Candidatus Deianiraea vastatrix]|uniref:UPF0235 protein Deia_00987 n=1 Tax=Candidatus Deianiraea vastatrix TaxID=2163644 RepID=A0A5B8XIE9_9RICK|nr:DUF167 domain-containing protein [Candidatus Deianiraea vastatrix]QED23771.1 hypothetical protein Deia_00987 [Candidatus Deianiraea vastatrix]